MSPTTDTIPRVALAPGRLPRTWERNVTFLANLESLFFGNEEASRVLSNMLGTLNTYGGRLAPIINLLFRNPDPGSEKNNLLIMDHEPDPSLAAYFTETLHLGLPDLHVASIREYGSPRVLDILREHDSRWIDGFVTDHQLEALARETGKRCLSTAEGSKRGNNKYLLHHFLVAQGLPVFDTEEASSPSEIGRACDALRKKGYSHAALKAQIGASGIGIMKCATTSPGEVPDHLFFEGPCLVQGWLDESMPDVESVSSPSVQIFVSDEEIQLFDITHQILDCESVHEGNEAPAHDLEALSDTFRELLRQGEQAAIWLHRQGYRGPASADFHVAVTGDGPVIRMCEVNARVTGATYPSLLARHFQSHGAWLMRNLALPKPCPGQHVLDLLWNEGMFFVPGCRDGCIPINFNSDAEERVVKGQFLFLGPDLESVESQLSRITNHHTLEFVYARD